MTINDIARESGYAVGTVSRVLNHHPGLSDEARKRVMEVYFIILLRVRVQKNG